MTDCVPFGAEWGKAENIVYPEVLEAAHAMVT